MWLRLFLEYVPDETPRERERERERKREREREREQCVRNKLMFD
jgi:hypothetical protein